MRGYSIMFAKLGLILLVSVFGVLLFVLGLLAPESMRLPVMRVVQEVTTSHQSALHPPQQSHTAGTALTRAKQPPEPAPIPYRQLLIQTPLPLGGLYALQLGQYPTAANAAASIERVRATGVPVTAIGIVDDNGQRWTTVAAGQYASPDDARAARISLARTLTLTQALPVIRLPTKPASASP